VSKNSEYRELDFAIFKIAKNQKASSAKTRDREPRNTIDLYYLLYIYMYVYIMMVSIPLVYAQFHNNILFFMVEIKYL